jgi:predicted amidohydrolase
MHKSKLLIIFVIIGLFCTQNLFSFTIRNCYELFSSKSLKKLKTKNETRIAIIEFNPLYKQKILNEEKLIKAIKKAKKMKADLVVTPELATTGYLFKSKEDVADIAEKIPGPFVRRLIKIAKGNKINIVTSVLEVDDFDNYYITAIFVDKYGKINIHRKNNITEDDKNWATPGEGGPFVFDTPLGRVAMGICMDVQSHAFVAKAYERGAEIFISPTASNGEAIGELRRIAQKYPMVVIGSNRNNVENTSFSSHNMVGISSVFDYNSEPVIILPDTSKSKVQNTKIRIGIADIILNN